MGLTQPQGKRQSKDVIPKVIEMLKLCDKDFKTAILTLHSEVKACVFIMKRQQVSHLRQTNS